MTYFVIRPSFCRSGRWLGTPIHGYCASDTHNTQQTTETTKRTCLATHPRPSQDYFRIDLHVEGRLFLRMDWCNTLRGVFQVHVCVRCMTTRSRIRVTLLVTDWVHRDRRVSTTDALNVLPSDTACPRRLHTFFHTDKTSCVILCFDGLCVFHVKCPVRLLRAFLEGEGRRGEREGLTRDRPQRTAHVCTTVFR